MRKIISMTFSFGLSLFLLIPFIDLFLADASAETLKIGVITSITGPMSPGFKPIYEAAKPAEILLNRMGGITVKGNRYDIEMITEDDQSSPPGAVAAANRLLQQKIKYIIPPMFIPSNMAISQMCEETKVIRMKTLGMSLDEIKPELRYSFFSSSSLYHWKPVYDFFQKNYPGAKRIAHVMPEDPGAVFSRDLSRKEIKERGLELVFEDSFKMGTEDYYPLLTKALQEKPDAIVILLSIVPWASGIINQSRELGFKGPIFCGSPMGDVNLINGIINKDYAYDIFAGGPDTLSDKMLPMVREHRKLVEQSSTNPYVLDSLWPLDGAYIIKQCIEAAQSLDTDMFVDAVENKMTSVDTIWGTGEWGGEDLYGIKHVVRMPIPFSRIMNGKVEYELMNYK
ncbi:MAG: ABC transporter substrate-binding protein [Deltaproteobacteria bacterium]|nr:ABC transporter substrate-binding protein [Deltaproteobacteria bacterium]